MLRNRFHLPSIIITKKYRGRFSRNIVTAEQVTAFQDQGVICIRGVFGEWIEKLTKGIERNLANPGKLSEWLKSENSETYYFNDLLNWKKIPEFKEFVFESPASEIAGKLMDAQFAVFYHEHVFTKDPGTTRTTPWHHDQSYFPVDGWKNCAFWIPVTPVSKASNLTYIGGSHKWGKWFKPTNFGSLQSYKYIKADNNKVYEDIPDIDGHPEAYNLLSWDLQPGDCLAFHFRILHGAKQSTDPDGRKVVAMRWLGEDATFADRPWEPSPNYNGGLKPGDHFYKSESFPVVWRSEKQIGN